MRTWAIMMAAALTALPSASWAGEVPVPAHEIRTAIVGRTLTTRASVAIISVSYTADNRYVYITGRDGGTVVIRGRYEVTDGKVCQVPDDRSKPTVCFAITKDGKSVYVTGRDGAKRLLESMY